MVVVDESAAWKAGDSYQDIKELTHGTEAKTSLTKSKTTGRVYVVKRFTDYGIPEERSTNSSSSSQESRGQPLPNEAKILLQTLRPHPNILGAFGCDLLGRRRGNLYTEFCNAGDLIDQVTYYGAVIKRNAPEEFVLHVIVSLTNALLYLHNGLRWDDERKCFWKDPSHTSVVHGDIKPDNVFLRWSTKPEREGLPDVVLGDFGQAQPASHFVGLAGTTGYQAPEAAAIWQLKANNREAYHEAIKNTGLVTPASDVFSLGQTIFILCTKRMHIVGADPRTSPVQENQRGFIGVKLDGPGGYQTEGLTELVQWCLQPDPEMRPETEEGGLLEVSEAFSRALDQKASQIQDIHGRMWAVQPPKKGKD